MINKIFKIAFLIIPTIAVGLVLEFIFTGVNRFAGEYSSERWLLLYGLTAFSGLGYMIASINKMFNK